jgi:flagellar biosynthesis/type III secretory pathway protein FliH
LVKSSYCGEEVDPSFKCSVSGISIWVNHRTLESHGYLNPTKKTIYSDIGGARSAKTQPAKQEPLHLPEESTHEEKAKSPQRNKSKIIAVLISLIIIGIISGSLIGNNIGFSNGYHLGFQDGDRAGNEEGQAIGYDLGYVAGNDYGYAKGHEEGHSIGYQMGFVDGDRAGYSTGFKTGNQTGYIKGFNECWQSNFQSTGYYIRDPTSLEALNFIAADRTNNIPYDVNTFNCQDFSATVKRNAFNVGYRAFFVYIDYETTSHSVVAFNTTDKGIIFIEPQFDKIVKVEVGKNYSTENGFVYNPGQVIIRFGLVP